MSELGSGIEIAMFFQHMAFEYGHERREVLLAWSLSTSSAAASSMVLHNAKCAPWSSGIYFSTLVQQVRLRLISNMPMFGTQPC